VSENSDLILFEEGGHRNVLLQSFDAGAGVPCNQHVIIDGKQAMVLDPGGTKLYKWVLPATMKACKGAKITHIFLSHQDPDIVAALNGWMLTTGATGYCSELWRHFIPHFGSDRLVFNNMTGIPDGGMTIRLGDCELIALPAHYLHSCGNFHVYDPQSKILYTGDLGASLGEDYREVPDFDTHMQYMTGFHRRYMGSSAALRAWVAMVRPLDVEIIAPQHGALFRGKEMCTRFLDWCDQLECGIDVMAHLYQVPEAAVPV